MSEIKVGIVGCGYIATKWHIPGYQRLKDVKVAAVCDISPQLSNSTAKKFKVPNAYSNVSDMLKKEGLDIVDICTPPATHASLAIQAMENGCHVMLEKPMALKSVDCDQMVNLSNKKNKKLCIIHNELFRPPMIAARSLVDNGQIGKVLGMQWTRFTHREEYLAKENHWIHKLPGGLLGETGPHACYTSLAFLKRIVNVDVIAKNNLKLPWAPFDYFDITMEGQDAVSSVIISHASDNYVADVAVFGSQGMIKIDLQNMVLLHYKIENTKSMSLAKYTLGAGGQMIRKVVSNGLKLAFSKKTLMMVNGHAKEIELFVQSVKDDTKPPVTGEEGRETIQVVEMIVAKFNQKYGTVVVKAKQS